MRRPISYTILAVLLACAPAGLSAQGAQFALGGLAQARDLPIEISADQLTVDQATGASVFSGNVVVGQGDVRLAAQSLRVEYGQADTGTINRLVGSGGVTLATLEDAAEADEAIYSVADSTIEMTGNVMLMQGANVLSGDRLNINLNTGQGTIDGRVRTILQPGR
ncbi:lipopolysaccharide transport periplasmic protein LptA [Roseicitreum antarcticum]|uniref:Lipopolysaccharide export system protein LptA n=1 Tax=Roseicitreum antarcticum TaxID=564137 RepID=A0A1H2X772_9RHOB|nr:lipopolysaccharide transport periplasmic protein LptA [Roseicitreum antarcticum]SDW88304.1 lipopolysaccharide export system protein LptA [Roseicitreum antarcticum]